jgi:copper homeostasis protein
MTRLTLEVIALTVEDAVEAARGGAHRLEIARDLSCGGLTPPVDLVRRIRREVPLPLRVMVRESDGFACSSSDERRALADRAKALEALGVDGIVLGWIRDGRIDEPMLAHVLEAAPSLRATFHRAFDALADPESALRVLQRYSQVDRVLTGGGTGPWPSRRGTLERYAGWAGEEIVILPGGGIDEEVLRTLAASGCVREAHVGRAARVGRTIDGPVSADAVRTLMRAAGWR